MASRSPLRLVGVAAALLASAACTPSLLEYPVASVGERPRPPAWDPYGPTVLREGGLALILSPVGLDSSVSPPVLRLSLLLRNDRDRDALWTDDPERFSLEAPGGPSLPLSVSTAVAGESREGLSRILRVPPRRQLTLRLTAPCPDGPLPEALRLGMDASPWGDPLTVDYRAKPRHRRAWDRRLQRARAGDGESAPAGVPIRKSR